MKDIYDIKSIQEGVKKKDFSCVELVDHYLQRVNTYDSKINAYLTLTKEEAYKKAKENDRTISTLGIEAFNQFPLLGVVVSHKDIFLTKDVRTTAGAKLLENYYPTYSSSVVEKLDKAGVVMLGKLNCDAWAHGSSGENSDFGPTKNPWDRSCVAGGSSSGSGASVAMGMTTFSTATDTCGSVRMPANFCGVVGLKPTYGSVSRYGVIAMASSLDSVGHITLTTADSEKVFSVTKGIDGYDSTIKERLENIQTKSGKKPVIGIPKEFFIGGLSPEVKKNIDTAIDLFDRAGYPVKEVSLPHTNYAISVYYVIQPAEVSSNLARFDGVRYGNDRNFFSDEAKRRIMLGTYVLSAGYYDAYYLKAMRVRSVIIKEINDAFRKVDVLIAPISPTPAFKLGEKTSDPLKMYLSDIYAATANLSGIAALALPFGFTGQGLPLGFQIMGPRFSEHLLFSIGKDFELFSGHKSKISNL